MESLEQSRTGFLNKFGWVFFALDLGAAILMFIVGLFTLDGRLQFWAASLAFVVLAGGVLLTRKLRG